jgi:hypothetical protein
VAASKRLRYEVFRRDNHACRYCGASAPEVQLTTDHVVPVALGGKDEASNLVTACMPCNSGKSSAVPDAPLVAEVAQDALRWSLAMRAATDQMMADKAARDAECERFREKWDTWTCKLDGKFNALVPKDPGWRESVRSLRAAGLPMEILWECTEIAMGRRSVKPESTFRYMCGIAWNKVSELQKGARRLVRNDDGEVGAPDSGRLEFARELLAELSAEERDCFLAQADWGEFRDEDDPPQTVADINCEAVSCALNSARTNLDWLATRVEQSLRELPDGIGERALAAPDSSRSAIADPLGRRAFSLSGALHVAVDLLAIPEATAYLAELTEDERSEWLEFATALWRPDELDPDRKLAQAARCARATADGLHYGGMCTGSGPHIQACPQRGAYCARITELKCCGPEPEDPWHQGHLVCAVHKELLERGTFSVKGRTFSASEFTAQSETVPF